ncbi:hypothetical protein IAD21_04928 [Abditibacteriota bacterium]|nr:hypothetical protein IAD21_04928 [Abditibacteriota bacterium]
MAITVDTKAPKSKNTPTPVEEVIKTSLVPQDKQMGFVALGLWLAALVFLCGIWWVSEATQPFAIGMPIWSVVAIGAYLLYGPNYLSNKLRSKGTGAAISMHNKPALKNLLSRAAPLLALKEPPALITEKEEPRSRVWPSALLFNKSLFGVMDDSEASVLAVRGLAHQKLGHARRLGLLDLLDQTPTASKMLVWPVLIYARLLRQLWLPHAQRSADRLALLLIRNQPLMLSAILKEYAATDAGMQELGVTSQDVTNWISQKGHIGMKGEEISIQYKLGRAIHEAPILEERIQELERWNNSPDFKASVEKLASTKK